MYANRRDKRSERINLSATPQFRDRVEALAEQHGEQMTTWLYEYVNRKMDEDFGVNFSRQTA
ncbi:MAG: hypothetical protein ACRYGA_02215 [Janthinobacterium lividum]